MSMRIVGEELRKIKGHSTQLKTIAGRYRSTGLPELAKSLESYADINLQAVEKISAQLRKISREKCVGTSKTQN